MNSAQNNTFLDRIFDIYEDNQRQIEELQRINTRITNLFINQVAVAPLTVGSSANPSLWTSNASGSTILRHMNRSNNNPTISDSNSDSDSEHLDVDEDTELSQADINANVTFYANENPELICPITLQSINGEAARINDCNHVFSTDALKRWFLMHNTCPVCRHRVGANAAQNTNRVNEPNFRSSEFYNQLDSFFSSLGPIAHTRLSEVSEQEIDNFTSTLQTFLRDRRATRSSSSPSTLSSIFSRPMGNTGITMGEFLEITSQGGSRISRDPATPNVLTQIRPASERNFNLQSADLESWLRDLRPENRNTVPLDL